MRFGHFTRAAGAGIFRWLLVTVFIVRAGNSRKGDERRVVFWETRSSRPAHWGHGPFVSGPYMYYDFSGRFVNALLKDNKPPRQFMQLLTMYLCVSEVVFRYF
jgi:hypothetical protein